MSTTRRPSTLTSGLAADLTPALSGTFRLADGREAVPVFQLLAERFLGPEYAPERVAKETGVPAATIRRIAAELAHAAFKEEITLDIPWTDWFGRRHEKMIGRPVGMHAMRGISAHANGFHTCRILHVLQILLGSIDCPAASATRRPIPSRRRPSSSRAASRATCSRASRCRGRRWASPPAPRTCWSMRMGTPQRIDKAFQLGCAAVRSRPHAHGDRQCGERRSLPVDVLFLYMANMGWNSSMNLPATLAHLTEKDPATGDYKIPRIIYSDAYFSETVPYADLILPDTTYLERWDCISLLDRPISEADGPADAIRQPVVAPDRNVRPFQDVLLELGARLRLPGMTKEDGTPQYPGGYPDYIVNHERRPASARSPAIAARTAATSGAASPTRASSSSTSPTAASTCTTCREHMRYFRHVNRDYIEWALDKGLRLDADAGDLPALQRAACRRCGWPRAGMARSCRPSSTGRASRPTSIRCRSGIRPSRMRPRAKRTSPCTPSRSGRWRCTTAGARRMPGCGRSTAPTGST